MVNQPNDLIKKLQEGDQMGFTALMDLYQNMVYNTALGIVQNEEDADDITQEVFEQVYISIGLFKGQSKLSTWLYKITITKSLDHIKKKKRKKRFGIVKSLFGDSEVEKYSPVEFNHPGVQLEQKERASELEKRLESEQQKWRQQQQATAAKVQELTDQVSAAEKSAAEEEGEGEENTAYSEKMDSSG